MDARCVAVRARRRAERGVASASADAAGVCRRDHPRAVHNGERLDMSSRSRCMRLHPPARQRRPAALTSAAPAPKPKHTVLWDQIYPTQHVPCQLQRRAAVSRRSTTLETCHGTDTVHHPHKQCRCTVLALDDCIDALSRSCLDRQANSQTVCGEGHFAGRRGCRGR